jgi:hypothetical protein
VEAGNKMVDHYSAYWVVRFNVVVLGRGSAERKNTGRCGRCCEGGRGKYPVYNGEQDEENDGTITRGGYK